MGDVAVEEVVDVGQRGVALDTSPIDLPIPGALV